MPGFHFRHCPPRDFHFLGLFGKLHQPLVRRRVLNYQLGLAVNGQDNWMTRLLQFAEKVRRVPLEVGKRVNVAFEDPAYPLPPCVNFY